MEKVVKRKVIMMIENFVRSGYISIDMGKGKKVRSRGKKKSNDSLIAVMFHSSRHLFTNCDHSYVIASLQSQATRIIRSIQRIQHITE